MDDSSQSVRVAVNVRPLVTSELLLGCTDCITVYPAEKQIQIGSHSFTFDHIFGSRGSPCSSIYDECVAPLVDALFHGYNGTVLAYGQTGSGKTYTMGTNYNGEEPDNGVIPKVMDTIFSRLENMKESTDFLIRVSFIEIFKEEVFDLLDHKTTGPARVPIQIRERVNGGITLAGVTEPEVGTKEEMSSYLLQGSLCRATGSTNMNSQSSRSHAIFTISLEQRKMNNTELGDDVLMAKLHLVDLAGSERAKRTGADGTRFQEGIHINKGLLALGNVISALGDDRKRKEGGHVPYRDSKLTRILQDSLGGNCKTIMIACVSPADTNAEETLNTLKYANRAKNIQNRAIINRDPVAAQMQRMRSQIEQLQSELLYLRGDSNVPAEDVNILKHKISLLEASNVELRTELQGCRTGYEHMSQRAIDSQVENDKLIMQIESIRNGKPVDEIFTNSEKDFDMVKSYVTRIQELEEQVRIKNLSHLRQEKSDDYLDLEDDGGHSSDSYLIDSDMKTEQVNGVVEDVQKELEHSSLQEQLDRELKELDKKLEQKEAEMKRVASGDTSTLEKKVLEKKVHELELEKRAHLNEIEQLRHKLSNISSTSDDSAQKLKEEYLQRINAFEKQVAELKKKQEAHAQLVRQKQKSEEASKRLQDEIQRIKSHKVQLQQKIKQESEQFRLWKATREKEVLQLKKEGRRTEYEMHKLLALNQKQKLVLQRKTEEAAMATKRLKELLDSRKASCGTTGAVNNRGPGIKALVKIIEHELEVTVGVHEVRSEYERQLKERAKMAEEVAKLKEEALIEKQQNLSEFPQMMSPGARNSRIFALDNMLATSSSALVSMASQLSEAEERERAFSGSGRWNHVRSLAEARDIMNILFNLASSSRCQLSDREVDCREKDFEIRDLKEKVVNLVRQLDLKKAALARQENLLMSLERRGHAYDLRPKGSRNSIIMHAHELCEDMDTSDDEFSCIANDDEDGDWQRTKEKKRQFRKRNSVKMDSHFEKPVLDLEQQSVPMRSTGIVCCSCSKNSSCKTNRCECRAANGACHSSCSCEPVKCSNRSESIDMFQNDELASHGAMLLQTALSGNMNAAAAAAADATVRRPLSDIGNNVASGIPKPSNLRKKWRRSAIQLVPTTPGAPSVSQTPDENNTSVAGNGESNVPLKLPRAMRSTLTINNQQLKERNSDDPPADNADIAAPQFRDGKENK